MQIHLPPQRLNRSVNGFVEHLHGVWRYPNESKIIENGPWWVAEQMVSIRQKTRNTKSLTSTTAQPFRRRFCGASSRSVGLSERVRDYGKRTIVSGWADGEYKAKNMKYKFSYLHNRLTVSWTVLWSIFTECDAIRTSLRSWKTDHSGWLGRW